MRSTADDDDTSDESEVHDDEDDPEKIDEAASKRPVYLVCNDYVWKIISPTAGAAGLTRVALAVEHASFFTKDHVEAISLFDKIGTNVFVDFAADQGARLLNKGFAQTPPECPHAKVEDDTPSRLYFDSSASQAAYEPA
jgi:hypothetical protein